ncbi:MAG: hypothetical protein AAGU18_13705 [Proteiniphilum sp.]
MGYIDEDGCFDLDNPDFADDYVFDYILQNLYPKGVEVTPEIADLYGSWEIKLFSFEKLLPTIKFPVTEAEFVKDIELKQRVEKFNNSNKINKTLKLEPLYYLTIYLFKLAKGVTIDSIHIGETRIDQITKIFRLKEKEDLEITFKSGKEKFVLTDKWIIDKILSVSFTEKDYNYLMGGDVDLTKKSENFSYTDASSVFAGYMFEYFNSDNSAKELISYLIYISGLVVNDSIIVSNDYINILLRNYRLMQDNDKKKLYPNLSF